MAAVLELHGAGVAWATSASIFEDVSLVLEPGFYGLVGANGAGKTTLLRVLAGELAPHEGRVSLRPAGAVVARAVQMLDGDGPTEDILRLGEANDGLAAELRGRLALAADELDRWPTLSPGERQRWQIGAALAREPDVLLLDEPTNHLDAPARERLLGALERYRGIAVVVSHDRALLERLPKAILRVHDGTVTLLAGAYTEARAAWERERRGEEEAHARARDAARLVERRLGEARRVAEATSRAISTRTRMKDKNDSDARGILAKNKASWADARAGRTVGILREGLARAKAEIPRIERDPTLGGRVFATWERSPVATLFHVDLREVRFGDRVVLRDVNLTVGREGRVRIAGPNGAGKTTLLRSLVAPSGGARARALDDTRLFYLPQELEPDESARVVATLLELDAAARGRVLSVFGALGSDPERLLRRGGSSAPLSPGEARKLALAMALGRHVWALVLDEPTNHLDLPTIERLEHALAEYPGAVVLVTHDDAFARAIVEDTVSLPRADRLED